MKPAPGLHPWNKSARRRKTKLFFPTIKQTADPESGKLQFKTHAGTNEKGGVANEGGIVRKPTFLFGEHPRQRVSFTHLTFRLRVDLRLVFSSLDDRLLCLAQEG